MTANNAPRPYSRLNPLTGHIEWMAPKEQVTGPVKRSRLETDAEVKARLKAAGKWYNPLIPGTPTLSGKQLDDQLEYWNLPPRQFVDVP